MNLLQPSDNTTALCSPGRFILGTAMVGRGFYTKDTSVTATQKLPRALASRLRRNDSLRTTTDHKTCRTASVSPDHKSYKKKISLLISDQQSCLAMPRHNYSRLFI